MRTNRRGWLAWAGIALLSVGGCASAPEEPLLEAGLANLRFASVTLFETTAVLDFRLENLAPQDLQVTGASHRVTVNGLKLGRGMTGESLTVPRLGSAVQSVEFHLRNLSLARSLHGLGRQGIVDYELESTVYVARAGGGERSMRIRRTGQLDLATLSGPGVGVP